MLTIPKVKPKSPTLLTIIAFVADFTAGTREYQKLIKRYEHKPTPSQPKNITIMLFPETSINIKKVKSDK